MYRGIDNWLKIAGPAGKISLVSKNGSKISAHENNEFMVTPPDIKSEILSVYSGTKLLMKKSFSIDTMTMFTFQLGNIQSDTASKAEVLANRGVRAFVKKSLYNLPCRIICFTTTFLGPNSDTLMAPINVEGNMLSKEQESIIRELRRNSKIIFDAIRVMTPNSRIREWPGFTLVIR